MTVALIADEVLLLAQLLGDISIIESIEITDNNGNSILVQ